MSLLKKNSILFFATSGFTGYLPFAPGTFGTLVGIPIAYGLYRSGTHLGLMLLLILVVLAIMVAERATPYFHRADPPQIVCDETVGFCVALFGLHFDWQTVTLGFILFRFFDILKPFPIRFFEKRFTGGQGIVADDIVAGLYANVLLNILQVALG